MSLGLEKAKNSLSPTQEDFEEELELSSSRPTKRPRIFSDIDDGTKAPLDPIAIVTSEAENFSNEPSREHAWHDSGLASSFPPVEDLEIKSNVTTLVSEAEPRTRRYNSSLYTDAFNLALDTVLAEESHLFSEQEAEIFQKYRSLSYEAQYLYTIIPLFLASIFYVYRIGN